MKKIDCKTRKVKSRRPGQQQSFASDTTAAPTPVVYHPMMYHPMITQSYQQSRSTQGYYPFMGPPYITYNAPASHTPPYYYGSNSQQISTAKSQANTAGARDNNTTLMNPQGCPATSTAPATSHPQPQMHTYMHQTMPTDIRPVRNKRSHRIPIIDPVTKQDILSDLYSNDGQRLTNDSIEKQTPRPVGPTIEEFNRKVREAAKEPTASERALASNYVSKNIDSSLPSMADFLTPQLDAMISNSNNITNSETMTDMENKCLRSDVTPELNEMLVLSTVSDNSVIVPDSAVGVPNIDINITDRPVIVPEIPTNITDSIVRVPKMPINVTDRAVKVLETLTNTTDNPVVIPEMPIDATVSTARVPQIPTDINDNSVITPEKIITNTDSMVVVPEMPIKQLEKSSYVLDINENVSTNKQDEHSKNVVSEVEEETKTTESLNITVQQSDRQNIPMTAPPGAATMKPAVSVSASHTPALALITDSHPQPRINREPQDDTKPDDIDKVMNTQMATQQERETSPAVNDSKDCTLIHPDATNSNTDTTITDIATEDNNKNEKIVSKEEYMTIVNRNNMGESDSYGNSNDETDKVVSVEDEKAIPTNGVAPNAASTETPEAPSVFVPKYKYSEDQWMPTNPTGKRCYDLELLKQIKEDPLSKNKPNIPLLETCNIMRSTPIQEPFSLFSISRPHPTESFLPQFVKMNVTSRTHVSRDTRKDAKSMSASSKGSGKLPAPRSNSPHKPKVIRVSLSLREDIKLNETENAWKPSRYKKENLSEEEQKTQELYKKFRGILNKLTPQKFDTLMEKVKSLEINNQERLEGVIDLVFEKAIDEPNFSKAYAVMCNKLSMLKVPADKPTTPDKCVNFRALIITKCQNQFVTEKVDEQVLKLEKELADCTDPLKKKELQLQLEDENRRVRMRSVGNIRFIGELYKLKMLTFKIMVYCMNCLIEKLEEEKLECLCKLLTTIGEQVENEANEQLDNVFRRMQYIVQKKSNRISSRIRFMIQDVIELRRRKWVTKRVVDSQPKTMDQIQKEAESQQRQIELMNASPMSGFRRDEGGRGKRNEGRKQNIGSAIDNSNNWKTVENNWKSVDTSKLSKGVMQKSFNNIKLAPQISGWNHGSGAKMITTQTGIDSTINLTKSNKYSMLEIVQTDPSSLRESENIAPSYRKGASTERSTCNSRDDIISSGNASVSTNSTSSRSTSGPPQASPVTQKPLPQEKRMSVKSTIELSLMNPDDNEIVGEVTHLFPPEYRAALVTEILNVALEKSLKEIEMIAKSLLHLVSTNTITPDNFVSGLQEIFEFAPDLYIDIPMLYDYLGKIVAPQIGNEHITFAQILRLSGNIISENHGHLYLKALINNLEESIGLSNIKSKWQKSGLQLKDWMKEDQIAKWIEDDKFQFLEGNTNAYEETKKISTPAESQSKSL